MTRRLNDWLEAYVKYTEGTETPKLLHFWCGVSALAGALRRRVWIDMRKFKWHPNFYVVLVARPGIIAKTTTMDIAIDLLKEVPGINFGPDEVTREGLVKEFASICEMFPYEDGYMPMSAMTLASGELGSLINPLDRILMNLYITLWDGRKGYEKVTKMSGNDSVEAPWINMIGCTTPSWIEDNMPAAAIGGGFTSRCVFVFADAKEAFVALPDEVVTAESAEAQREALVADLQHIAANLVGPMFIDEEARVWIRGWYQEMWTKAVNEIEDSRIDGFVARKQTHLMKLAMVICASRGDDMTISLRDVSIAFAMLSETEKTISRVFSRIGRSESSLHVEKLLDFVRRFAPVTFSKAYEHVHSHFPDAREFGSAVQGLANSGQVRLDYSEGMDPAKARLHYLGVRP